MKKLAKGARKFKGFTLVELVVVITILAILATVGFLALSGYTQDAKDSAIKANTRSLQTAISSESAITGNSPRFYVTHDEGYSLSWAMVFIDGIGIPLTGGNVGQAPFDSNYTAGKPDFAKLKLNPEKFRISASWLPGWTLWLILRTTGFESASAAYDPNSAFVGAMDFSRTEAGWRKRSGSFFQVWAVSPITKTASVTGNFPTSGIPSGYSAGLIKANPGTSVASTWALVDGTNPSVPASVATDGTCGSAKNVAAYEYPSAELCSAGSVAVTDSVGTDGAYDWSCSWTDGGETAACSAPRAYYGSCFALLSGVPGTPSGTYSIDPDGTGGAAPYQAYCDMVTDGGGWTLAIRLNTNDATKRKWDDTAFWNSTAEIGTLSGTGDYLSKSVSLVPKDVLLKYVYQNNLTNGTWTSYRNSSNAATLNANLNLALSSSNPAWSRLSYSSANSVTTEFFGTSMYFSSKDSHHANDYSRIFYNPTNSLAVCNQGGSIGHIGDYGSNNWNWEVARGWSDASACQHNTYKLGLGANYDPVSWGTTAVTPSDLYSQGIMYVMVR